MELDEIKNKWSETDVLKGKLQVNDNRIKEMLKNEGESVLSKLIRTTKFSIIIPIPAGLLVCLHSYSCSFEGYYMILPLIFLLICILLVPLNSHRYRLLKGIDYSRMSVKEVSEKILKYQNNVQKWQVYHTIGFFVFLGVWYFLYHKLILGSEIHWEFIIFATIICLVGGLLLIPDLYEKFHYNNINRIKKNLKELKEFEE